MMRSKPASSMQKTYDECYLICSTAVYFEGQNNEAEALRSWRNALETILHYRSHRIPTNYVPKTETERALQESLQDLELQCKERVDLLEALRKSREEAEKASPEAAAGPTENEMLPFGQTSVPSPGWIGDGTIPSLSYPELSRPPALPRRPAPQSRSSLDVVGDSSQGRARADRRGSWNNASSPSFLASAFGKSSPKSSSSPDRKRTFLTTLRGKDYKSLSASKKDSSSPSRPDASKAAGLAWTVVSQSPGAGPIQVQPTSESGSTTSLRQRTSGDGGAGNYASNEHLSKPVRRASERAKPNLAANAAAAATNKEASDLPEPSSPLARPAGARKTSSSQTPRSAPRSKLRPEYPTYRTEFPDSRPVQKTNLTASHKIETTRSEGAVRRSRLAGRKPTAPAGGSPSQMRPRGLTVSSEEGERSSTDCRPGPSKLNEPGSQRDKLLTSSSDNLSTEDDGSFSDSAEAHRNIQRVMKDLPKGVDINAARQILNEIVVRGDEVHWDDVAGLETAKKALKEAVVYPFLRPDLFMGLREPARGMLLFGPPGTGKTMLARAVATESRSTFFSVSASSLTSKWHGESEKLVRALFALAKVMAPSIIFVDEIDSLLSTRSTAGEGEASRRSKTEFLIQWSDLQRAAAGREQSDKEKRQGDPSRVLVLAATNMPWDIDEAARRRFVRRQYIPLPEDEVRKLQFEKLLSHQKHELTEDDINALVKITDGFSGSDITALAKDAAMGPLRNLGEALLHTPMDQIPPIQYSDFEASLRSIRPSVSREGLKEYEQWATDYGERGG